jgi:hypothetical protein
MRAGEQCFIEDSPMAKQFRWTLLHNAGIGRHESNPRRSYAFTPTATLVGRPRLPLAAGRGVPLPLLVRQDGKRAPGLEYTFL